jgi:hypothetical protein
MDKSSGHYELLYREKSFLHEHSNSPISSVMMRQ